MDVRSLAEWRMEKFRLLQKSIEERGEYRSGSDANTSAHQSLKNLELSDLIEENKCLWEKVEAQQVELKHLKSFDWGRERSAQGKDHLIEVLKAQKVVLEQKIKRLNARKGFRF